MNKSPHARWRHSMVVLAVMVAAVMGVAAWGEHEGWPWLVNPVAKAVGHALGRTVSLNGGAGSERPRIQLWGGVTLSAPEVVIGAPRWSREPFTLKAEDAELRLAYGQLWSAYRGQPFQIDRLRAREAQAYLSREASGRNSWTFGPEGQQTAARQAPGQGLRFGTLNVDKSALIFQDDVLAVTLAAQASVHMGQEVSPANREAGVKALEVTAKGHYKGSELQASLSSVANAPGGYFGGPTGSVNWPVNLDVRVGQASLKFIGTVDPWGDQEMRGRFWTHGPSLAAAGEPFGLTLPTTGAFKMEGLLSQGGASTSVVVSQASLGSSRLAGEFVYDRAGELPLLAGRLRGSRLALSDLGPAIGVPAQKSKPAAGQRVLPDRSFDLPSLGAMNANVLIDIGLFDVGEGFLKPLKPLKGHLVLENSVLSITDLSATTAGGQVAGKLTLDGRQAKSAIWRADLRWKEVQLDDWIPALKPPGRVPYATGKIDGRVVVTGKGKSTAAILASLGGTIQARLREGTLSHLGVELAGIDLAEILGVYFKGDNALPISCARADVAAVHGVLRPDLFVLSTQASTIWAEGSVSLVDEQLGLQVRVAPKDFSPLTLRTPIQVTGTLGAPKVSIEVGKLLPRIAGAVALGVLNPVAAIVPLFDTGNKEQARKVDELCQQQGLHLLPKKP